MKGLGKRRELASKVLGVGKKRICFDSSRLAEIKEAITRQDIKDLHAEGAISIKDIGGRKKNVKRARRRGPGKIKKIVADRKGEYVLYIRKLRRYLKELKKQKKLSTEEYADLKKKVKAKVFRDKAQLKDFISGLRKQ